MNDIAWNYQVLAEIGDPSGRLSLSEAELRLSKMPSIARGIFPAEVARALMGGGDSAGDGGQPPRLG
jgi:hypothetical protein